MQTYTWPGAGPGPHWLLPTFLNCSGAWQLHMSCPGLMGLAARWLVASTLKKAEGIQQVWHAEAARL